MQVNTKEKEIAIVGSGLVGSLLAIFMARRGYTVNVYERRSDMRKAGYVGGRSINLAMSYRGWKALEKAGIAEDIRKTGIAMPGRMIHQIDGSMAYQAYGTEEEAIFSVSRGGLNLALIELADKYENVHFHFDYSCEDYNLQTKQLTFTDTANGKTITTTPHLVFGVDGAFSAIRYSLMKRPGFNFAQEYLPHGYKELTIAPTADAGFKIEKHALHIWPRGNFMLIALPNPDGSFTCTLFLPMEGEVSFEAIRTDEDIQQFFEKWFPDTIGVIDDLIGSFKRNPTSSLVTIKSSPWCYANSLLLGDAAHAIVPFYGQGMNAGFQDCTVLDSLMDEHGEDWETIFERLNTIQVPNGHAIAELAQRNFVEMRDLVGDPKFLLRKKIAAWFFQKYPDRFLPVYSMVTFRDTPYHEALAEDNRQNAMFAEILAMPDIENKWDSPEVEAMFTKWGY